MKDNYIEYRISEGGKGVNFIESHQQYDQAVTRYNELIKINPELAFRLHKCTWHLVHTTPLAVSQ